MASPPTNKQHARRLLEAIRSSQTWNDKDEHPIAELLANLQSNTKWLHYAFGGCSMFPANTDQKSMAASLHDRLNQDLGRTCQCDKYLAKAMGVTLPTISNWAKSKSISSSKSLDEIAQYVMEKSGVSETGHSDRSPINETSACPPSLPSPITRASLGSHGGTFSQRFPADDSGYGDEGRGADVSRTSLSPKIQQSAAELPPLNVKTIVFSVMYNNIIDEARSSICESFGSQTRQSPEFFDRRSSNLPKWLLGDNSAKRGEIELDGTVTVQQTLGIGAYGTVLLCSRKVYQEQSQQQPLLAVKVQSPTKCLAHEHNMLCLIRDRVQLNQAASDTRTDGRTSSVPDNVHEAFPFPVALSYIEMQDGALMGMSAADSSTGHNLLDLVNAYKSNNESVPELIAIHYTCRMLHHLEILHNIGKILHNDVKPDNWVVSGDKGCDLTLVDFGRSVDLLRAGEGDYHSVVFVGSEAACDMACPAMRDERPWCFDTDAFGICSSFYVLLCNSHLSITKESSGRWVPSMSRKRYWWEDGWNRIFDDLMNAQSADVSSLISAIRIEFEAYLDKDRRRSEIGPLLTHQHTLLPRKK